MQRASDCTHQMGKNLQLSPSKISSQKDKLINEPEQWSSYKECKGNALALGAEEGRSDLR